MIPREHITGAILAGGRGRRMGGMDKGLMVFRGRPLIGHVIEAIAPQVGPLLISANRNHDRYAVFGHSVIADANAGFAGPLAGIARALERADTPYVLIAPCDMPFLPEGLAARLASGLGAEVQAAAARGAGRLQPLCVLLRREAADHLRHYREGGEAKAASWLLSLPHAVMDFEDAVAFRNINSPSDILDGE